MGIKIVRNDIVRMRTDAIVNTASAEVCVGDGCDRAVYEAAGYEQLFQYRKEKIGRKEEGEVFLTPGFSLQAKYIIHAVSPFYLDGNQREEEKLRSCYRRSLVLAKENGLNSISFPVIATGSFRYPLQEGIRIALDEIYGFLEDNELEIYLVVFDKNATEYAGRISGGLADYVNQNYVDNQIAKEYTFSFRGNRAERSCSENPVTPLMLSAPMEPAAPSAPNASAPRASNASASRAKKSFLGGFVHKKESHANAVEEALVEETSFEEAALSDVSIDETKENDLFYDVEQLEEKLNERMKHLSDSFSDYLLYLIQNKGLSNVEVYKKAIVDKKTFSKIKNDKDYHPQKLTALCLCIGAELNMDETKDLLARAGYALSPCDKTDIIFSYFIENGIYDMIELDIQLEEYGLPCIIA